MYLVIQTAFIGDAILATAVVEKLHCSYPGEKVDLLVRKGNEALFEDHPFLNELLIWDKKKGKYKDLFRLLKKIRKKRYHRVIDLHRFASTGFLTGFSKAKEKVGFDKNPLSFLFTTKHAHEWGTGVHEVERNLRLVEDITDKSFQKPRIHISEKAKESTASLRRASYFCIAPTSVWFTKQWPPEKWVELIDRFAKDKKIYLIGGPDDREACRWIQKQVHHPNVENTAGDLGLMESAALIADAERLFVNDSAPLHLASSLDTPTTAIFCSTIPEFGFGPLAADSKVVEVQEDLDCRPCGMHGFDACPKGHFKCAWDIDIAQAVPEQG